MATDANIRVINNEEHEGIFYPADGLIMSDDLLERMGGSTNDEVVSAVSQNEAALSIKSNLLNATITGYLHTIQFTNTMNVSFEVANCNSEMLQTLHHATSNKTEVAVILTGDNGFESQDSVVSSFGLVKMAPHSFLLTIAFVSDNVIFR